MGYEHLIISLLLTLIAYGAFPLIFAFVRKTPVGNKAYTKYCYFVNAAVAFFFLILNGGVGNVAPYIIWTSVFVSAGKKILAKKDALMN